MHNTAQENGGATAHQTRKHKLLERSIAVFPFVGFMGTIPIVGLLVQGVTGCVLIGVLWSLALIVFVVEITFYSRIWYMDPDAPIDPGDVTDAEILITSQIIASFLVLVTGFSVVFRIAGVLA